MARTVLTELAQIVQPKPGRHRRPQDGVCTMELVAWMSGERHSDRPRSVSPVIAAFTRAFNDALGDAGRQRLGALAPRMIDSRGMAADEVARRQILWDWMVSTAVPAWLVASGHEGLAATVARDRAAALPRATAVLDSFGHVLVRPADDDRTARAVTRALGVAGISGACMAGRDAADRDRAGRARRHWEAARVLARTAAWEVAESEAGRGEDGGRGPSLLWRTAGRLCESAFDVIDRLIAVTPAAPGTTAAGAPLPAARDLSRV